jgi:hypothetical protein
MSGIRAERWFASTAGATTPRPAKILKTIGDPALPQHGKLDLRQDYGQNSESDQTPASGIGSDIIGFGRNGWGSNGSSIEVTLRDW